MMPNAEKAGIFLFWTRRWMRLESLDVKVSTALPAPVRRNSQKTSKTIYRQFFRGRPHSKISVATHPSALHRLSPPTVPTIIDKLTVAMAAVSRSGIARRTQSRSAGSNVVNNGKG